MPRTPAASPRSAAALTLVEGLQRRFAQGLEAFSGERLASVEWLRDSGRHGGGMRHVAAETRTFNRAAINVSSVHYDDEPAKKLAGATALSTIIHPDNPLAPSVHMHLSYTELRDGSGSWRLMADLNPSNDDQSQKVRFIESLKRAAPALYAEAARQGDRYFFIPALGRHRGITHFYVEQHSSGDFEQDLALAQRIGASTIDTYLELLRSAPTTADEKARAKQLWYHTAYLFQVLTLDRGTTSGLLVHDQNDVGIMGSLPARVDRALLATWAALVPPPQDELVRTLVDALPASVPAPVSDEVRAVLAGIVRRHYQRHPHALDLQAAGDVLPPTVDNHR
ncbi:MAG: coproporphyrinogen III oxidase [Myxococcaceae bacterium]|nr:coproporphyrinogen III oxidase [Myxococcaceae bacterium]